MHTKRKHGYEALVDGATQGLSDSSLFEFVRDRCPNVSSKRIVRASLMALTDPALGDRNILHVVYALAIEHRMDELGIDEDYEEDDIVAAKPSLSPQIVPAKQTRKPPEGHSNAASQARGAW